MTLEIIPVSIVTLIIILKISLEDENL